MKLKLLEDRKYKDQTISEIETKKMTGKVKLRTCSLKNKQNDKYQDLPVKESAQ